MQRMIKIPILLIEILISWIVSDGGIRGENRENSRQNRRVRGCQPASRSVADVIFGPRGGLGEIRHSFTRYFAVGLRLIGNRFRLSGALAWSLKLEADVFMPGLCQIGL